MVYGGEVALETDWVVPIRKNGEHGLRAILFVKITTLSSRYPAGEASIKAGVKVPRIMDGCKDVEEDPLVTGDHRIVKGDGENRAARIEDGDRHLSVDVAVVDGAKQRVEVGTITEAAEAVAVGEECLGEPLKTVTDISFLLNTSTINSQWF